VQSAITPGFRASSSLILKTIFHQVGADVGDLGEDAARHAQRRRASDSPIANR